MTRSLAILLFSCFVVRAGVLVNQSSLNKPIAAVVTDASATPTGNQVTVSAGWNGFRVWTGEQPVAEAYFDLYVSRNGGAVVKFRVFRWQGRIITATSGDVVSLGTSDGRTLYVTPMYAPTTTETASGTTGTANCDKAGPPLWSPTAPHITLPANARSFQITADGTERDVFISEYDGSSWTPVRWLKLEAARSVTVRTSYRKIALANYAGATLSITAQAGTVIGGSMATMSLNIPAATGTTHNVSNPAEFDTAVAAAVAGDRILFAVGATAITNNITAASFTANVAAGRKGSEGIIFEGAATDYETVCPISGDWDLTQTGATLATYFKNLKWSWSSAINFDIRGGDWKFEHCRFTGGSDNLSFRTTATDTIQLDALYCQSDTSSADCFAGNGGNGQEANSVVRLIDCVGFTSGAIAANQVITSHTTLAVQVYGGTYSDAHTNVIASDADTAPVRCFFVAVLPGARNSGVINSSQFGSSLLLENAGNLGIATNLYCVTSSLTATNYAASNNTFSNPTTQIIEHNKFTMNNGRVFQASRGGGSLKWNIVSGGGEVVRVNDYTTGSTNLTTFTGNTVVGSTTAFGLNDNSILMSLRNNACATNGTSVSCTATGNGNMVKGYNVLDPTVSANYTAGTGDTTGANAALDSNLIPTASGNCDGNGDTSIADYLGASDPFGLVLIYKSDRISRGAREIPAVYASTQLYPDLW